MEDRVQHDQLLVKYLADELTEDERYFVLDLLKNDEQYRLSFEALKKTWELICIESALSKVNIESEWKQLESEINADKAKVISISESLTAKTEIQPEPEVKRTGLKKLILIISAAAAVLIMFFIGNRFLTRPVRSKDAIAAQTIQKPPFVRYEKNITGIPMNLLLADGSTIVLYPGSDVHFQEPFTNDRRDISLNGQAFFIVAKDKAKPFTVFSDEIATTAVGTRFMVTSRQADPSITVQLSEGKVVVKPVEQMHPGFLKELYLLPGQQLIYDKQTRVARVGSFKARTNGNVNDAVQMLAVKNHPVIPIDYKGSWFMFNNQPLDKIFESLEQLYDTKIIYSRSDFSKQYFIGTFNKADSLEAILKKIASLNKLDLKKENNVFIIRNK